MSNARSHRRQLTKSQMRTMLASADSKAPGAVIFGSGNGDGSQVQPIKVGQVLYLVAVPPESASELLLGMYSIRATATVSGTCPACHATRHIQQRQSEHPGNVAFLHENDCPAHDDAVIAQFKRERPS